MLLDKANRGDIPLQPAPRLEPKKEEDANRAQQKKDLELVGRTMFLEYLGREMEAQAPQVYSAWIADRDLRNLTLPIVNVRVLLSKDQLSDLNAALHNILDAAESSLDNPENFFDQIRSVSANTSRDPQGITDSRLAHLGQVGLMADYLEGLPYRSRVLDLDSETWKGWSITQQQEFIDNLKGKIKLYKEFHDDTDRWVALQPNDAPGGHVYPIPLDALP
ncbi:hypothetical protein CCP3SC15_3590004 [Gammaproteobacteria bacterium]